MDAERMRQRAREMAGKLRQRNPAEQKSKGRHKAGTHRGGLLESQMKKLQERRHRSR
ncbi:hypothetical protein AB0K80_21700 [Streptomyces sp. NPDC052682]|uniref:hypothetical protein n=1 Tax=Streptomyces sp. NPDC052682 TaxID=3154954 RepID=UPI0034358910